MDLQNKAILITGASRGIGAATAILAGENGAKVAINYLKNYSQAQQTAQKSREAGARQTFLINGDVSNSREAKKIVDQTIDHFGTLDILINNAGIISWKALIDEDLATLHKIVDVNIKGIINTTYAAVSYMKKQPTGGVIINIASEAGQTGYADLAVYSATKFAVVGLTQSLGQELSSQNIRVYSVSPGMVATDMTDYQGMPPEKVAQRILQTATESLKLKPGQDTEIYR